MTRTVSPAGRKTLMDREGVRLTAYRDTVGNPTIGVGHFNATPPVTTMGMTITMAQAEALLTADLAPMERAVNAADIKGRLSQNAFDATASLTFNIGVGAFTKSTVARLIASGDMQGAADAFLMWAKPPELAGRRKAERAQFLTPDGSPMSIPANDQVTDTKTLQSQLAQLRFYSGPIDGDFGPLTQGGVKSFQLANGLTADGVAGPKTWDALTMALAAKVAPVVVVTKPAPIVQPVSAPPHILPPTPAKTGFWAALKAIFSRKA